MKILVITDYYRDAGENGSEVQCADLIDALRARHTIDVLARRGSGAPQSTRQPRWAITDEFVDDPRALGAHLIEHIDIDAYDCVYNLGGLLFGCRVVALLRAFRPELPLVNHFHALLGPYARAEARPDAECAAYAAVQHDVARDARLNIVVSHAERAAARTFGMPEGRCLAVIADGLPFDAYANVRPSRDLLPQKKRDAFVILTAGRFEDYIKGADLAYRAFALLAAHVPDAFLLTVSNSTRFQSLLRDIPAERHLHVGWLARPAFLSALAGADLVLLPSRHEPFGLIAIEALAFGVPVVASAVGGLSEIVRDGAFGRLAAPRDGSFGLFRAMLDLGGNRTALAAMGRAGQSHVRDTYSLARFTENVDRALREACGKTLTAVVAR